MQTVTIQIINEFGFFVDAQREIPDNLAEILKGINAMYNDGIFKFKPHLKQKRDIYTICIETDGVNKNILEQVKDIAIKKECDVKIDTCYHWLYISNKKELIDHYFKN